MTEEPYHEESKVTVICDGCDQACFVRPIIRKRSKEAKDKYYFHPCNEYGYIHYDMSKIDSHGYATSCSPWTPSEHPEDADNS